MPKRLEFKQARFILGEGEEDASFAREVIARRNIAAFDVSPTIDVGGIGGSSGFEAAVLACQAMRNFPTVTEVVILADNDDNPTKSFSNVRQQIERLRQQGDLSRQWGDAAHVATKAAGDPSVSVWMWPAAGQKGCLETLLWQFITRKYPRDAACVEVALKCTKAAEWPKSKTDKARVRCFLSIVCRKNPAVSLSLLWRDFPQLIPVTEREFTPFSYFLQTISTDVSAERPS